MLLTIQQQAMYKSCTSDLVTNKPGHGLVGDDSREAGVNPACVFRKASPSDLNRQIDLSSTFLSQVMRMAEDS